jgi:hypothetical protein
LSTTIDFQFFWIGQLWTPPQCHLLSRHHYWFSILLNRTALDATSVPPAQSSPPQRHLHLQNIRHKKQGGRGTRTHALRYGRKLFYHWATRQVEFVCRSLFIYTKTCFIYGVPELRNHVATLGWSSCFAESTWRTLSSFLPSFFLFNL